MKLLSAFPIFLIIENANPAKAAPNRPIKAGKISIERLGLITNNAPINIINKKIICLFSTLSFKTINPNIVAKKGPSLDKRVESDKIKWSKV